MKIGTKALCISIIPTILIVAILMALLLNNYRSAFEKNVLHDATVQLESLANFIDGRNLQAVSIAKSLASTQKAGLLGDHQRSMAIARQTLSAHTYLQGAYFGYESDIKPVSPTASGLDKNCCTDGRFIPYFYRGDSGIEVAPLTEMETGLYYQGVKQKWQQSGSGNGELWLITEPYVYEGVALVEQVYPLIINNQFAGIAGVDRNLNQLLSLIADFRPYQSSKTYLISRLGKFITTTDRADELSMQPLQDFPELARLFKQPPAGQTSLVSRGLDPNNGESVYIIYTRIPTGEWGLVTTIETRELLAPVTASTTQALIVAVVLLLILSLVLYLLVTRTVSAPLGNIVEKLQLVAQGGGNLKTRVEINSNDEIGSLADAFNQFVTTQASMIGQIDGAVNSMDDNTVHMKRQLRSTVDAVSLQQAEHIQVSAAVTEMSATAKEVAENVTLVASNISEVSKDIIQGQASVNKTVEGVDQLQIRLAELDTTIDNVSRSANEIGSVLEVINSIAEQTNLLALNAAIEAARAGEQGRGFAVVADEVRTLAQRTQTSTREIQQVIETLQETSDLAVSSMSGNRKSLELLVKTANVAGESLGKITASIDSIESISTQISAAAEQQSVTTDEIDKNIHHITASAKDCGQLAQQSVESLTELEQVSQEVGSLVAKFEY